MSKNNLDLKNAIHGLNIKKPFDLRAQSKPALKRPADPKHAQVEQVHVESAQPEHAHIEPAPIQQPEREQGFFMLAHSIFENKTLREVSGDSFRIFMWMSAQAWRFRGSSGEFRASVEYVSLKCGCSRSTATRGLQDLKKQNLIECVEQNFKKGNLWRVSRVADGRRYAENEEGHQEPAKSEQGQDEEEGCSKSVGSSSKMNMEHAQNEQQIISSNKIKNSQHTQDEGGCEFIKNYLKGLVAEKKRASELSAFRTLLEHFEISDLALAFSYLSERKFVFKETEVHSPLAFLTYAMGEVLPLAKTAEAQRLRIHERMKQHLNKAHTVFSTIHEDTSQTIAEFETFFPVKALRDQKIDSLCEGVTLREPSERSVYAARRWWLERETSILKGTN